MSDHEKLRLNAVDDSEPPIRREWTDVAIEGVLFLPNTVKLIARLIRDPRVPIRRKVPVVAAMGYVLVPIDLIPDSIPGIGLLDDVLVVSAAVDNLLAGAGHALIAEHWDGSIDALDLVVSLLRSIAPGNPNS